MFWKSRAGLTAGETGRSKLGARVQGLEWLAGAALVFVTVLHGLLYFEAMSRSSMWTDELGSIKYFTALGPWHVVTDYSLPRNHIFFSLLNSLLPGADRIDPLRARAWSYLFTTLLAVAIVRHFFRARKPLEGGAMFFIWGMNGDLLELSLQARGYGLLSLLAFGSSVLALRYCEQRRFRHFAGLSFLTLLGTYTIPAYILFGGPLMLLLAFRFRDRRAFRAGAVTLLGILVLYAPVAGQLASAMATYGEKYGYFYSSIASVFETFRSYLWPFPDWAVFGLLIGVAVAPFWLWERADPCGQALRSLVVAALVFLGFCLWARTPPVRTTAFVALPLAYACVGCARKALGPSLAPRLVLAVALLAAGPAIAFRTIENFRFVPYENWSLTADFIHAMYPPGTIVDFSYSADGLTYYLDQDRYRLYQDSRQRLKEPFLRGEVPVVVAPWKYVPVPFHAADWSRAAVEAAVPGKIRNVYINFVVPGNGLLGGLPAAVTDRNPGTFWKGRRLLVQFRPGKRYHSLNLLSRAGPLQAVATAQAGPTTWRLDEEDRCTVDRVTAFRLGGKPIPIQSVTLEFAGEGELAEIWAFEAPPTP